MKDYKRPEHFLRKHYLKWIERQTGRPKEEAEMLAECWEPEQQVIDAMHEFAAQFVDDWEDLMNRNFPKDDRLRSTIGTVSYPINATEYEVEEIMNENNIDPDDIINIISEGSCYTMFYHAAIIPKRLEENESS